MTSEKGLSLLDTPRVLEALGGIAQSRGHPILEEDVCLWVGEDTHRSVIARAETMPYFPVLEPADLWAVSGIAIYEKGPVPRTDDDLPSEFGDAWIAAQQWWTAPRGLIIVNYGVVTLDYFLKTKKNVDGSFVSSRWRTPSGSERISWYPTGQPSTVDTIEETDTVRFVTSGDRPLLLVTESERVLWDWGSRFEMVDKSLCDFEPPPLQKRTLGSSDAQRGAPSMEHAAWQMKQPAVPCPAVPAGTYTQFWTVMQTAAAPASALPRRFRRPIQRQHAKQPTSRGLNNLWVVDLPRILHEGAPIPGGGGKHSYRYPVRGHWREQWYSSVQRNKPVWIEEHERGPEGAPKHDYRADWQRDHPVYRVRIQPFPIG